MGWIVSSALGVLTLDLVAKIGGFTGPLDKAGRESKKFQKSVTEGFDKMGAAIGIAAVAAAGGIALFVKQSIDAADEASKTAQAVGLSVEAFTGLQYAAKLADIDTQTLKSSMSRLNVTLGEASTGGKEQASIFKALGISIKDASGELRTGDEVLKDLAEKFADMPDGVDKSATAIKIFGKAGAQMIPFLNSGRDGIEELITQAKALGLVLTDTQAKASEQFNDSLTTLGQVTRGAANNVAKDLLPALNSLTGMMIDVAQDTGTASDFGKILAGVFKGVAATVLTGATAFMNLGRVIGGVAAAASLAADGEFKLAYQTIKAIGVENKAATAVTDERIKKLMSTDYEAVGKKAANVANIIKKANDIATDETKKLTDAINDQIKSIQLQAETLGWSENNIKLYELAQKGATPEQLKSAKAALDTVAAFKAEKDAMDGVLESTQAYSDLVGELMTDEEKWVDQTKKRLAIMSEVGITPNADISGKIVASGITKAPTFSGVDAVVGGAAGEIAKIDQAAIELEKWKTAQIEKQIMAQELADDESELFYAAEEAKFKIYEEFNKKKDELDKTRVKTQMDLNLAAAKGEMAIFQSLAESMGELTRNFAGESSAAYKAMFAIQKIFAAAMIIVNTHIAASQARATSGSFISGEALAAMVMVTGYANAGIVAGMGLAGMAHDGMESIPQDGTWLLKKGERVSTAETSAKLDKTLDDVSKQSSGGDAPIINLFEDKSKAGTVETRQQDDKRVIDIWVADLMGDGKAQKAMSRKFGLQPVGA